MNGLAVHGEDMARHIIAGSHCREDLGIRRENRAELGVAVLARIGIDRCDHKVVDHPTLVPAALVVDDEQSGNIGEDVDERSGIPGIGGQAGLGLERDPHGADRRQPAVAARGGQLRLIVDAGDPGGEDVRLKAGGVQQVVLEQLARLVGFGERLHREKRVRAVRHSDEPLFQRLRQVDDVPAVGDCRTIRLQRLDSDGTVAVVVPRGRCRLQ